MADTGKIVALINSLAKVDPEIVKQSVEDWLDDHPEATTTVQDGSITKAKLDSDLQDMVDDVSDLKNAINDKVEIEGTDQVTAKNLQIMEKTYSPNLLDETKLTLGKFIGKNGTIYSGNYNLTDYIPVEAGEQYFLSEMLYNTYRQKYDTSWFALFNSDKTVNTTASADISKFESPFTVPNGVAYVRVSFGNSESYTKWMFEKNNVLNPTYYPYGEVLGAVVKDEYLPDEPVDMADIPAFELVRGQNLLNPNDPDYEIGKFLSIDGSVSDNASYITSGYIAVKDGDNLLASYVINNGGGGRVGMRTIACYNADKVVQGTKGVYSVERFVVPSGVAYVRVCYHSGTYGTDVQVIIVGDGETYYPYKEYEDPHYEAKESYLPARIGKPVHVYLPPDIYVAIGRTVELYNEQVVLDHEKYHFQWSCIKGAAYKRKFSITGVTAGNLNLTLQLYDDDCNLVWAGASTIHVVAASNPEVTILPIGDSLTNWKAWLQETMLLSSNSITFVGTRYSGESVDSEGNHYQSGTIHSEGRSGWSAGDYLTDSTYTFDNRYDGVPGVSGTANPFWNGTKFSLNHYLTTQTGVSTPDAIQIFLGTNDLTESVETAVNNITELVTSIRTEYSDIPIFVCNTIYRSNQNGYGSTGNDAYSGGGGAGAWQYEQDIRVMDLMVGLRKSLANVTRVTFIPLASCMDREYGFGQVMTKVNPRSAIEVPMPDESVHPVASGYYQMADLMYSVYCGILGS